VRLLTCALLFGCASEDSGDVAEDVFRVALLTSGPVSDAGWYAGAYEGLQLIGSELGAQVSHQQTRTPAEFDEAMLSYAGSGYDLVFAHGFEYQDAAMRVGPDYPGTTFIISSGGRVGANVIPLIFQLEEGSYLAGMAAGALTRTGIVGMVGGVAIPPAEGTFVAFEAGARSVNPDVQVRSAWIGSWDDVAAAKEAAVAQIRSGADILIHNTDAASFGVFQAVREAREGGDEVWAMGMNKDQNAVAPDVIIGSAVIRIPQGFLEIAKAFQAGTLEAVPHFAGGASGVVDFVVNPVLRDLYSEDLLSRLDAAMAGIQDGSLEIPRIDFVDRGDDSG
jgi:basic membrane lipoprotein Med (substrate-binding protein (PBP1-ABC) superfamily)